MSLKSFTKKIAQVGALLASSIGAANAGTIFNWDGGTRTWNNPSFSILNAQLTADGHTILPNSAISDAALSTASIAIISEVNRSTTPTETQSLFNFINNGGFALFMIDTGTFSNVGNNANSILSNLGSNMSYVNAAPTNGPLQSGTVAVNGPPYNLAGQTLSVSPGYAVTGGTQVAGSYVRYQPMGNGGIFVFADRVDVDVFTEFNPTNVNIFRNIVENSGQRNDNTIPEPGTGKTTGSALLGLMAAAGVMSVISKRRSLSKENLAAASAGSATTIQEGISNAL